jgi:hypothetical protein
MHAIHTIRRNNDRAAERAQLQQDRKLVGNRVFVKFGARAVPGEVTDVTRGEQNGLYVSIRPDHAQDISVVGKWFHEFSERS